MIVPARPLTPMEAKILPYVARGLSYEAIALALPPIRPRTVRAHVCNIADKLPPLPAGLTPYRWVQQYAMQEFAHDAALSRVGVDS